MLKNKTLEKIEQLINKHNNILLFHHVNPDGDCMATSFGLASVLQENYPDKNIKVVADMSDFKPHLSYMEKYLDWENTTIKSEQKDYLAIIGDTSVENRVRFLGNFSSTIKHTICFDHHENELLLKKADVYWNEPEYPAAALMAYEIITGLNLKISSKSALIINHGILTDTSFYKTASSNSEVLNISSNLNKLIDVNEQKNLYIDMHAKTKDEIAFHSWVLSNYKTTSDDKVAYCIISEKIIKKFNLKPDQAARSNYLEVIKGVEAWMFFVQYNDFVRIELRSRNIFVNEIATEFNGGGHKYAAGAKISNINDYKKVLLRVKEEINKL